MSTARLTCRAAVAKRGHHGGVRAGGGEHAEGQSDRQEDEQHQPGRPAQRPEAGRSRSACHPRLRGPAAHARDRPSRATSRAGSRRAGQPAAASAPRMTAAVLAVLAATQRARGDGDGAPGPVSRLPGARVDEVVPPVPSTVHRRARVDEVARPPSYVRPALTCGLAGVSARRTSQPIPPTAAGRRRRRRAPGRRSPVRQRPQPGRRSAPWRSRRGRADARRHGQPEPASRTSARSPLPGRGPRPRRLAGRRAVRRGRRCRGRSRGRPAASERRVDQPAGDPAASSAVRTAPASRGETRCAPPGAR